MADETNGICKKPRLDEDVKINEGEKLPTADESIHETLKDLNSFKLGRVLNNNTKQKSVCLLGKFQDKDGQAVVLLEKTSFADQDLNQDNKDLLKSTSFEQTFHNDIYGSYSFVPTINLNKIKATVIHPATENHIVKYSSQQVFIIEETPHLYQELVLPHILQTSFDLSWVHNILQHKSESDRIVFEDPDPDKGFILLPDLKWNGDVDTLYLLAIPHACNIKSLRDLNNTHLPMLKNILASGREIIKSKYGLTSQQLRIYVHYQPSFYHFHVHFTNLKHEAPGILTEKAHLLTTIINNIELISDYYEKSTLPFIVRKTDKLYDRLKKANEI